MFTANKMKAYNTLTGQGGGGEDAAPLHFAFT